MTKCFSCGKYTCRISGDDKLLNLIPNRWEKYRQKQAASSIIIMIKIEEEVHKCGIVKSINGFILEKQGHPTAVYYQNGIALFSLQYTKPFSVTVGIRNALDSYFRIGIHYGLMLVLCQECIGVHGVTILCGNEIVILSAPSGTGKTTLARLLENYCDAIVINGDFALLSPTEDGVWFEPTPFCGTSGRALNHRFRVNRMVFLSQAKDNIWCELDGRTAMKQFMNNCFIPTWDREVQKTVQENILKSISVVKVNAYAFAPTQEAAEEFLRHIEK